MSEYLDTANSGKNGALGDGQESPRFVTGIVIENNNPEQPGKVKVDLMLWSDGEGGSTPKWAKLIVPYGGPDYGTYMVPEIDDTVLVAYIGSDRDAEAYVLGSVYNEGSAMESESQDKQNYIKHVKTKGGTDVLIQDEEGKQSITITTPKGSVIMMEDEEETCLISDKDEKNKLFFDYKNGEIELVADKKITLKSRDVELVMDGESDKFALKAKSVEAKGGNSVKLESGSTLSVTGESSTIEGRQTMAVKGGNKTDISGSIVKIN